MKYLNHITNIDIKQRIEGRYKMTDYVINEDGKPQQFVLDDDEEIMLTELLEDNYPYILEEIEKEDYILEYDYFVEFTEIVYENKVVGFYTTVPFIDQYTTMISLEEIYVMPDYRGNHALHKSMLTLFAKLNKRLIIRNPTRVFVEKLINGGFAIELDDNIIYSPFEFFDDYQNVYQDSKIAKLYDFDELDPDVYTTNLYDLKHCSIIAVDNERTISDKKNVLVVSTPRISDMMKYNLEGKLKKIDKNYSRKVKRIINNQQEKMEKCDFVTALFLHENTKIEHLIGTEDKFSELFKHNLEEYGLTEEEGLSIRQKISEALENDEITEVSLMYRLDYLLKNPGKDALVNREKLVEEDKCPFCGSDTEDYYDYCEVCGLLLNSDDDDYDMEYHEYEIDEDTKLEVGFQDKIISEGYQPDEIYKLQLEIAVYYFLYVIDSNPASYILANNTDRYHIADGSVEEFLESTNYVEKKVNNNYNPERLLELDMENYEVPDVNFMDEYIYKITKKGRRYYKKNKTAKVFNDRLHHQEYYEFYYYCRDNPDVKVEDNADRFYELKLDESITNGDERLYLALLEDRLSVLLDNMENMEKLCLNIFQSLIASVNSYRLSNDKRGLEAIDPDICMAYTLLKDLIYEMDIERLYDEAFDGIELEKLKINREEIWNIIRRLRYESIHDINRELMKE
ncbi:MAG: TFIIB-type zinc ribbon-containing protein [Methanosphaera sp.]|nr:TFIIB-type zinc ribbon-containing protein [Methanosphaera sp.]